jgi:hypothetical protein
MNPTDTSLNSSLVTIALASTGTDSAALHCTQSLNQLYPVIFLEWELIEKHRKSIIDGTILYVSYFSQTVNRFMKIV